jgi:hypothetical protein
MPPIVIPPKAGIPSQLAGLILAEIRLSPG